MKHLKSIITFLILAVAIAGVANVAFAKEPVKVCKKCGQHYKGSHECKRQDKKKTCTKCGQAKSLSSFSHNSNICCDCVKKNVKVCTKCHKSKSINAFSKNGLYCKDCQKKLQAPKSGSGAVSLYNQAINYYYGSGGVSRNVEKAIELFVKSASQGDGSSLDGLQYICKNDNSSGKYDRKLLSCKELFTKSKKIYEEGSGNTPDELLPQYYWALAMCYIYGIGTQRDKAKAEEVFDIAAEMGPYYRCYVARVYEEGDFGAVDYKKALELYEIHYDIYSPAKAATFYIEGKGTTKNIPKALELLQFSIEAGVEWEHPANYAKYVLGKLYFDGEDVEKDYDKAFKLFKEAAEEHEDPDCDAMYMLSICYRFGFGTKKDLAKANYWLEQAKEHGSEDA